MASPASIAPRSLSLPSPDDIRRASIAYPVKPEPHVVCADAPLTPPLSPKPGNPIESIPVDEGCAPMTLETHQIKESEGITQISADLMDVDAASPLEETGPEHPVVPRPQRLLEDEKVHLQRSGIKLSDFEVRGTLGMSPSSTGSLTHLIYQNNSTRYWNLWEGPSCSS